MSLLDPRTEALLSKPRLQSVRLSAAHGRSQAALEAEIAHEVQRIIDAPPTAVKPLRRGGEERYAYPHEVYLTPISREQEILLDSTIQVLGKHISAQGLDFCHQELLPFRHMIASFRYREGGWLGLLLELTWCRFIRRDAYENGGRFLRVVLSPLADHEMQLVPNHPISHALPALYPLR